MTTLIVVSCVIFVVMLIVLGVKSAAKNDPCFWGHDKRYVSLRDLSFCPHYVNWTKNNSHFQDARWLCARCPAMGEECIDQKGVWMIHQGVLVPDEKRWASWRDKIRLD